MSSHRITIRVPETLSERLRHRSRIKGKTESELVREALDTYLGESSGEGHAYLLAKETGLIGCVSSGNDAPPKDLSTNPRYLESFGKASGRK